MPCYRALLFLSALSIASALDNGLALAPILGWNTWKTCGDEGCTHDYCDEHEVMSAAEAMIANGMVDLGWTYVNLDDCWAYSRDNTTNELTWDTDRFPSGLPYLTSWLHDRGLKFGLYTSIGNETCSSGGRPISVPGSEGHFQLDAQTFADWGVDYVKLDWCGDVKHHTAYYGLTVGAQWHKDFATALNATGRPMYLEAVAGYYFLQHETADYANAWRFCGDHHDDWVNTAELAACRIDQGATPFNLTRGEAGAWPYMDFLMTGGEGCAPYEEGVSGVHCPQQTEDQYETEFSVWTITQSPLIVATDVRNLTDVMQRALLNAELLEAHQSVATGPGTLRAAGKLPRFDHGEDLCLGCQVWGRDLHLESEGATVLVALVNWSSSAQDVTATWAMLGIPKAQAVRVRDLWLHENWAAGAEVVGADTSSVTAHGVAPGGAVVLKLTPVSNTRN
mmetsp:Transcript_59548/g.116816  ORF Transcript_59548/g.116816 Transcript_59548/m.116816 type:complete len:450 (+) Transcript_59548:2-1351(+)